MFYPTEGKNAILLVLIFKEISLGPEVSSKPLFRIQGGVPWAFRTENVLSYFVFNTKVHPVLSHASIDVFRISAGLQAYKGMHKKAL